MDVSVEKLAIVTAIDALAEHCIEEEAARQIKEASFASSKSCLHTCKFLLLLLLQTFDRVLGPQWHCVVGKQFGCFVSHFNGLLLELKRMTKICRIFIVQSTAFYIYI